MNKIIKATLACIVSLVLIVPLSSCIGGFNMSSGKDINSEIFPDDFDMNMAKDKGIGSKDTYLLVQKNYQMLLNTYLNSLYDFTTIDARLNAQGFVEVDEPNYYQKGSDLGSKYFYLRNNVHVERLNQADIDYLKSKDLASNDQHGLQIVKDTCEDVLAIRLSFASASEYQTSYREGSSNSHNVKNTDIAIFLDYKNVHTGTINDPNYVPNRKKDAQSADVISQEIIAALDPAFDVDVIVQNQSWSGSLE